MTTLPTMRSDDLGKLLLRLAVGGLLLPHGIAKLQHGIAWMGPLLAANGIPGFVAYGAYVGEVVAPILILLGVLTRPAGMIVAFHFCMAIYLTARDKFLTFGDTGGLHSELEMFFILGGLAIFFLGAGRFSVTRGKGDWS
jgi:putative oxidoreductase